MHGLLVDNMVGWLVVCLVILVHWVFIMRHQHTSLYVPSPHNAPINRPVTRALPRRTVPNNGAPIENSIREKVSDQPVNMKDVGA